MEMEVKNLIRNMPNGMCYLPIVIQNGTKVFFVVKDKSEFVSRISNPKLEIRQKIVEDGNVVFGYLLCKISNILGEKTIYECFFDLRRDDVVNNSAIIEILIAQSDTYFLFYDSKKINCHQKVHFKGNVFSPMLRCLKQKSEASYFTEQDFIEAKKRFQSKNDVWKMWELLSAELN